MKVKVNRKPWPFSDQPMISKATHSTRIPQRKIVYLQRPTLSFSTIYICMIRVCRNAKVNMCFQYNLVGPANCVADCIEFSQELRVVVIVAYWFWGYSLSG